MDFLSGLGAHWYWLLLAALLGIFEIVAPGIFLIWLAAAAAVTGITVALLPIPLPFQLALFGLLALAAVYSGRRHYERNPVSSEDPKLNDRTARLIGETVTVVTAIEHGEGRVKVGDSVWPARGPDTPAGGRVTVTGAQGNCLLVRAAPALPPAGRDEAPGETA
jgi:membrane protein implicated in regulation of membrane protease activity